MAGLAGQLAAFAVVSCQDVPVRSVDTICHADVGTAGDSQPQHRGTDCALCPLCLALAMPVPLVTPNPVFLPPSGIPIARAEVLPPARAPPLVAIHAATYPTGPPSLA